MNIKQLYKTYVLDTIQFPSTAWNDALLLWEFDDCRTERPKVWIENLLQLEYPQRGTSDEGGGTSLVPPPSSKLSSLIYFEQWGTSMLGSLIKTISEAIKTIG